MVQHLRQAGFNAFRKFDAPPAKGDVLLVGLGGSALLYVIGHDEKTIDRVVQFLQTRRIGRNHFFSRPAGWHIRARTRR